MAKKTRPCSPQNKWGSSEFSGWQRWHQNPLFPSPCKFPITPLSMCFLCQTPYKLCLLLDYHSGLNLVRCFCPSFWCHTYWDQLMLFCVQFFQFQYPRYLGWWSFSWWFFSYMDVSPSCLWFDNDRLKIWCLHALIHAEIQTASLNHWPPGGPSKWTSGEGPFSSKQADGVKYKCVLLSSPVDFRFSRPQNWPEFVLAFCVFCWVRFWRTRTRLSAQQSQP